MQTGPKEKQHPSLSVIVPTYHEAENLPELIERVEAVRDANGLDLQMLIMDDNSDDGSEEVIATLAKPWVQLIIRKENRGLSPAVLDGFEAAENDILLVMDADLSHPPEKIPELMDAIEAGADFAVGSRYVSGASTDEAWGLLRAVNSRAATLLARPFTWAKDPMSGFFAIRKETYENAAPLNPIGYKIGLEMLVKGGCRNVSEIPIHFSQRHHGESKLSLSEQVRYLQHLRRLANFKFGNWAHLAQFCAVGFSGTIVNLTVLTTLLWMGISLKPAVAAAILLSMLSNFLLNRRITFSYARGGSPVRQLLGFIAASSLGAAVNYATVMAALRLVPSLIPQAAAIVGILAGMGFNFLISRYLVFRRPDADSSPRS